MTTHIRILNATGAPLTISSAVSPALPSTAWSVTAAEALPLAKPTDALWLNRDVGITDGKTWAFATTFTLDGVAISLEEIVTGTATGSNMAQAITASALTTGYLNTNDARRLSFTGASGALYEVGWVLSGTIFKDILYTVALIRPAYEQVPPVMPQIETIVMLMLENRSLDNVLGWLYADAAPALVLPAGSAPRFDGIPEGAINHYGGGSYRPSRGTQGPQACRFPAHDPNEPLPNVAKQLYGDGSGRVPSKIPWGETPSMQGFVADYREDYIARLGDVMGAYSPEQLPVLSGLATSFAVSDRWFCSAPTQTNPNRAFSICGTSLGAEVNDQMTSSTFAFANTIFNVLDDNGKATGFYWQADDPLGTGEPIVSWKPFTSYYFPRMNETRSGTRGNYTTFLEAVREGTLPSFSFLEPYWGGGLGVPFAEDAWIGIQGTDYHPPAWIGPAEAELAAIYKALVESPQWPNMLLVITFDEHGGTWDHVPPPATTPPDGNEGPSGFAFDRLGVRVPMILVSPFIEAGTVFRAPSGEFDHTSLLATLCKWAGVDPASAALGARTASAPTFEGVISRETARTDKPSIAAPDGYATQGGGKGTMFGVDPAHRVRLERAGPALDVREFRDAAHGATSAVTFAKELTDMVATKKS